MPTGVNSMALFRNLITRHRCRHREENDERRGSVVKEGSEVVKAAGRNELEEY